MVEIDAGTLKAALLGNQVAGESPHAARERLKRLVNGNRWAVIGHMFGFEPKFMLVGGTSVFDWNSCNEAFWNHYNAPPEPPSTVPYVYSRSERSFTQPKGNSRCGRQTKSQRRKLWNAQQGKCFYCSQPCTPKTFTVDHIVPKSKGGSNGLANKVGACLSCNNAKGSMSQEEFLKSHYLESRFKWIEACRKNESTTCIT